MCAAEYKNQIIKIQNEMVMLLKKNCKTPQEAYVGLQILQFDKIVELEMIKLAYVFTNKLLSRGIMQLMICNSNIHNYETRNRDAPSIPT